MRLEHCLCALVALVLSLSAPTHAQTPVEVVAFQPTGTMPYLAPSTAVRSGPAVSQQATVTVAAVAGKQHVADCVSFSAASTTAPVATALTINLRDGTSGAGTVLWSWQVVVTATTGQNVQPHSICGLRIPGTVNTAMTLEFSALLTNLIQSVALTYYDK